MKFEEIFIIILVLIGITFAFVSLFDGVTREITYTNNHGNCYDVNHNLILGVYCSEEIKCGIISKKFDNDYCYGRK